MSIRHPVFLSLALACSPSPDGKGGGGPQTTSTTPTVTTTPTTAPTTPGTVAWDCVIEEETPEYATQLGCMEDFDKLASAPLVASIPGARSTKTVLDQLGTAVFDTPSFSDLPLYFQNSQIYPIHWNFASTHLSGMGNPLVPDLGTFNLTEYTSPDRRFVLGAITWYEEPQVWTYEIAPYDTASAEMLELAYRAIAANTWFGDQLYVHPGSVAVEAVAAQLPADVPVITTDELFEGVTYQPLNLATTTGLLTFHEAADIEDEVLNFRELVVLDAIPNDLTIVAGVITDAFQTPLSHINVLSQNRGTPNMALKGAYDNPDLRALEGLWVELTVEADDYTIFEITAEEAADWWEANKPDPLDAIPMDTSVTGLIDAEDVLDLETYDLGGALAVAIPAFGGKGSHYGGLVHIGPEVPVPDAFMVPLSYYDAFMRMHGLYDEFDAIAADADFQADPTLRAERLEGFQETMQDLPLDPGFEAEMLAKLDLDYPGVRMRFRSSTNAEDLGDFTGAGLYTSAAGTVGDGDSVQDAIREVWSSVFNPRAYEERDYYSIDHTMVGMSLLVHPSFPDEEANGVAITANIFDTSGLEPGFYVNVQAGGASVVKPEPGIVTDQFVSYHDQPGSPVVYLAHSNLVPAGETVLTATEVHTLGNALAAIRDYFYPVYGVGGGFYGMDTEFKFDGPPGEDPVLWMKQARPYPGWGG
jgi:pyruvate, water dikinase